MLFKVSTLDHGYTKHPDLLINNLKKQYSKKRFYKQVVNYNDIIDLSFLSINEDILVIGIQDKGSEKYVICNAYKRVE